MRNALRQMFLLGLLLLGGCTTAELSQPFFYPSPTWGGGSKEVYTIEHGLWIRHYVPLHTQTRVQCLPSFYYPHFLDCRDVVVGPVPPLPPPPAYYGGGYSGDGWYVIQQGGYTYGVGSYSGHAPYGCSTFSRHNKC